MGFTSFLFIHPFANLKNFFLFSVTFIFEPNEISLIFPLLFGSLKTLDFKTFTLCVGLKIWEFFYF